MIAWTPAARQELRRHAERTRHTIEAAGADPAEVLEDLERHLAQEATAAGLAAMTEEDVRRFLARLGPPPASPDGRADPGVVTPLPDSRPAPAPSAWLAVGGVLLPLITLAAELITGMCAATFLDPLGTWWHVLLVGCVPLANGLALHALRTGRLQDRRWLGWATGLAFGITLFYSILFTPLALPGLLAVIFYGFGLLPLTPLIALVCTVFIAGALRRWGTEGTRVSPPLAGYWRGAALAWLALVILEAPIWITRASLALAVSDDAREQQRGLAWLRWLGREDTLLRECYGRTRGTESLDLVYWLASGGRSVSSDQAREIYYRVTGRPFNAVPAPKVRSARGVFAELNEWTWDADQGGERVGGRLRDLALHSSRLDAVVEPDAALAYLEWTIEFRNSSRIQREARAQIQLPAGGVVSRLTLWVNGEEREAAFAGRAQTRQAYQQVAIRQRRDPVLVTTSGPDRILMQCFPVPPDGGVMRVRIGITAPLSLSSLAAGELAWPRFLERNFNIPEPLRHTLWVETKGRLEALSSTLHTEQPKPGVTAVRGLVRDPELSSRTTLVRVHRDPVVRRVWSTDARSSNAGFVQGTLVETQASIPARLVLVVDGSREMRPHLQTIATALAALPEGLELAVIVAADEPVTLAAPASRNADDLAALRRRLAQMSARGGQDNLPALMTAWDLAAQRPGGAILWVHATQPVLLSSAEPLRQAYERRRDGPRIIEFQVATGPNRILEQLDGVDAIQTLSARENLADELTRLFKAWQAEGREVRLTFEHLDASPAADDQTREASAHLVRLWAAEQVRWLQAARRADDAIALAASHQLVTPLSGAVVLETAQQYAQHGLTPADPTTVPAIPEPGTRTLLALGLAALLLRPRQRAG